MNKVAATVFETFPFFEIWVRSFLHRHPSLKEGALKRMHGSDCKNRDADEKEKNWSAIRSYIVDLGIEKGDLLLVHSSSQGLFEMGVTPKEIIDFLLELLGEDGTLVMAAYPKCKKKGNFYFYDPKRTVSWTGMLPNVFLRYDNVVRSECPVNSLAAKGKLARDMMNESIKCRVSQGEYSEWDYLARNHVKILYLGVMAAECCTMLNYAEGKLGDKWPIKDWFCEETYEIKRYAGDMETHRILVADEEKEWYQYYKMFYIEKWMRKNGFLENRTFDGVYVGITQDGARLANRVVEDAKKGKLIYNIPKRFWKSFR